MSPSSTGPSAATLRTGEADRALAALAAAFRPAGAGALLAHLADDGATDAAREADRLAARPRRERLAALASALAALPAPPRPADRADRERPKVRAALERLTRGLPAPGVAPALARLWRERAG